jgi:hypothetical protein
MKKRKEEKEREKERIEEGKDKEKEGQILMLNEKILLHQYCWLVDSL